MNIEGVHVKDGDVILITDPDDSVGDGFEDIAAELHARYPNSLVMILAGEGSIESRPEEELRALLEALVEHQQAR